MQILFHSASIRTPSTFASGLDGPPPAILRDMPAEKCRILDDREVAWLGGFDQGTSGRPYSPPVGMGHLLKRSWRAGHKRGSKWAPKPAVAPAPIEAAEMAESGVVEDVTDGPEPEPVKPVAVRRPAGISPADRAWFAAYSIFRHGGEAEEPDDVSPPELESWRSGRFVGQNDHAAALRNARVLASA